MPEKDALLDEVDALLGAAPQDPPKAAPSSSPKDPLLTEVDRLLAPYEVHSAEREAAGTALEIGQWPDDEPEQKTLTEGGRNAFEELKRQRIPRVRQVHKARDFQQRLDAYDASQRPLNRATDFVRSLFDPSYTAQTLPTAEPDVTPAPTFAEPPAPRPTPPETAPAQAPFPAPPVAPFPAPAVEATPQRLVSTMPLHEKARLGDVIDKYKNYELTFEQVRQAMQQAYAPYTQTPEELDRTVNGIMEVVGRSKRKATAPPQDAATLPPIAQLAEKFKAQNPLEQGPKVGPGKLHPFEQAGSPSQSPAPADDVLTMRPVTVKPENLFEQAKREYPILNRLPLQYKYNPGGGEGFLEFWPGEETGTAERPRPQEFAPGQAGVEVYDPETRPIDVMGDVASHYLINTDPTVKAAYQQFEQSLTPAQKQRLQGQYVHAQQHEGETRPFDQWYQQSGLPSFFRGYAFQQWERPEEIYTPEQMQRFDRMMAYLKDPNGGRQITERGPGLPVSSYPPSQDDWLRFVDQQQPAPPSEPSTTALLLPGMEGVQRKMDFVRNEQRLGLPPSSVQDMPLDVRGFTMDYEPPVPLTFGGAVKHFGEQFLAGIGHTTASSLRALGLIEKELDAMTGSGPTPRADPANPTSLIFTDRAGQTSRVVAGRPRQSDDYAFYQAGRRLAALTDNAFPGRPDLKKNFLLTVVPQAMGSSVPFIATGAAGAAIGTGAGLPATVTGALAGATSSYERGEQAMATDAQKRMGLVWGGILGAAEGAPIADLFRRLNQATGGGLREALKIGTIEAIEESVQEGVQQLGENTVAKYLYQVLGQDLTEGVGQGMVAGGLVGFLTGAFAAGNRAPETMGAVKSIVSGPATAAQDGSERPSQGPPPPTAAEPPSGLPPPVRPTGQSVPFPAPVQQPTPVTAAEQILTRIPQELQVQQRPQPFLIPRQDRPEAVPFHVEQPTGQLATPQEQARERPGLVPEPVQRTTPMETTAPVQKRAPVPKADALTPEMREAMAYLHEYEVPETRPEPIQRPTVERSQPRETTAAAGRPDVIESSPPVEKPEAVELPVETKAPVATKAPLTERKPAQTLPDKVLDRPLPFEKPTPVETAQFPLDVQAQEAATSPTNDLPEPTEAQQEAGNYKKGHVRAAGLDITIENPEGSIRSGKDPDGKPWTQEMAAHYGYIRSLQKDGSYFAPKGTDKEGLDIFIKPGTPQDYDGPVFVIDQKKPDGRFDEHKILMGPATMEEAQELYQANYAKGWDGIRSAKAFTMPEFKEWLKTGNHTRPVGTASPSFLTAKEESHAAPFPIQPTRQETTKPAFPVEPVEPRKPASFPLGETTPARTETPTVKVSGRAVTRYIMGLRDPVKQQYARDLIQGLRTGQLPPTPSNLVPAEVEAIQRKIMDFAKGDPRAPREKPSTTKGADAEKPGKEPWQMTRAEWFNEFSAKDPQFVGSDTGRGSSAKGSPNETLARIAHKNRMKMGLPDRFDPDLGENIPPRHKEVVEEALRRGLPVPEQVLADYPDLAQAATAERTETARELSPEERERFEGQLTRALARAKPIGKTQWKLVDTTEQVPDAMLTKIAADSEVERLATTMNQALGDLQRRMFVNAPNVKHGRLIGLSPDARNHGSNRGGAILINPYQSITRARNQLRYKIVTPEQLPFAAARDLVDTMIHEATHQQMSGHKLKEFGIQLHANRAMLKDARTRWIARLTRILESSHGDQTVYDALNQARVQLAPYQIDRGSTGVGDAPRTELALSRQRRRPRAGSLDSPGDTGRRDEPPRDVRVGGEAEGRELAAHAAVRDNRAEPAREARRVTATPAFPAPAAKPTAPFPPAPTTPQSATLPLMAHDREPGSSETAQPPPEPGRKKPSAPRPVWADELESVGGKIDDDGTVLLYHATTKETAAQILKDGWLRRPSDAPDSYGVYFSSSPTVAEDYGDGTVIPVRVRAADISPDDVFPGKRLDFSAQTRQGIYKPVAVGDAAIRPRSSGPHPGGSALRRNLLDLLKNERGSVPLGRDPAPPKPDNLTKLLTDIERQNVAKANRGPRPALFDSFDLPSETTRDLLRQKLQDKFLRVQRTQQAVEQKTGKATKEAEDTYLAEELFHGKTATKLEEFERDHVQPLIDALAKEKVSLDELDAYLYATHAPERNAKIAEINPDFKERGLPGSGMSDEQAQAVLEELDTRGLTEKLERLATRVKTVNDARLTLIEQSGLETPETVQAWREAYEHYVPLKGQGPREERTGTQRPRTGKGFDIRGKESKRALGRVTLADSPVTNSLLQMEETLVRAEKNAVGQAFLRFTENHPNPDLYEINKKATKTRFDERSGEVVSAVDPLYKLRDNVLSVKRDGQEYLITLHDEALARSMKNLGADRSGKIVQMLQGLNRYFAFVHTSLNPEFVLSNFTRDLQTAGTNLAGEQGIKMAAKVLKDTPAAIRGVYQGLRQHDTKNPWAKTFQEFKRAGGAIGFFGLESLDQKQTKLRRLIQQQQFSPSGNVRKIALAIGDLIMDVNGAVESGVRLAAFKHAREAGLSEAKAASLARNLTVNFNRKGELGALINGLYLFYNAGLQGSVRLFTALKHKGVRRLALGMIVGSVLLTELNRILGGNDPDDDEPYYDKIDDWIKEHNLILMKPDGKGGYYKLPLPYGYNVFHVAGQSISDVIHLAKGDKTAGSYAKEGLDLIRAILNSFNPLGGEDSLLKMLSPTITDPLVELGLNENFFGAPIKPDQPKYGPPKPESELYWSRTSPTSKDVTAWLNRMTGGSVTQPGLVDVSPAVLDHLVGTFAGGAGATVNRAGNLVIRLAKGEEIQDPKEVPFVRRFVGSQNEYSTPRTYREHEQKIEQAWAGYEHLREAKQLDQAKAFKEKNAALIALKPLLRETEKKLRPLYHQRNVVRQADLSDAEKQTRLDVLKDEIQAVQRQFNKHVRKALAGQAAPKPGALAKEERLLEKRLQKRKREANQTPPFFRPTKPAVPATNPLEGIAPF